MLADRGYRKEARTLLKQVYGSFSEGFATADLKAAADMMSALG
jgi:hypothetical protein